MEPGMKLASDRKGSVLIEAALVMPVIAMLLLATLEFGQAFTAKRRTGQVASTAADLVARTACVTPSDLQDVSAIGGTILKPYKAAPLGLRITSVTAQATVQWSYGSGTLAAAQNGAAFPLPASFAGQNKPLIVAEATYGFTPTIGKFLVSGVTFSTVSYNYSRLAGAVPLKTAC
jgi:Flp pilus assembly protein TadG